MEKKGFLIVRIVTAVLGMLLCGLGIIASTIFPVLSLIFVPTGFFLFLGGINSFKWQEPHKI